MNGTKNGPKHTVFRIIGTVNQVCTFTVLTVKQRRGIRHKYITEGDYACICARNYEGTE